MKFLTTFDGSLENPTVKKTQWVYEQDNGDLYFLHYTDIPKLQQYDWSAEMG